MAIVLWGPGPILRNFRPFIGRIRQSDGLCAARPNERHSARFRHGPRIFFCALATLSDICPSRLILEF